jgi:hypothetical protein
VIDRSTPASQGIGGIQNAKPKNDIAFQKDGKPLRDNGSSGLALQYLPDPVKVRDGDPFASLKDEALIHDLAACLDRERGHERRMPKSQTAQSSTTERSSGSSAGLQVETSEAAKARLHLLTDARMPSRTCVRR